MMYRSLKGYTDYRLKVQGLRALLKEAEYALDIEHLRPRLAELETELTSKARNVMIKLSPMLDLTLALQTLHHVNEVHVVSANGECKELLLILAISETRPSG